MKYSITASVQLLVALISTTPLLAQSQNAADCYRIAAKQVPTARDDAETHVLVNVLDAPLDDPARALLDRGARSLDMFDVATQMPFGTWGFDTDEPMTAGRVIPNVMELADLVILRARVRAAGGDDASVLDDAYKLVLLSRRLSVQPSLPRQLQQNALFDKAAQLAGLVLLDVKREQIEAFTVKLNELRSAADPIDVIEAQERAYLLFHRQLVEDPYLRRITEDGIGPFNSVFGAKLDPVDVSDLLLDNEAYTAAFSQTEGLFSNMTTALKLPPGDREIAISSVHIQSQATHPLARTAMQMMDACLRAGELNSVQLDMLQVAMKICSDEKRPYDPDRAKGMAGRYQFEPRGESGFILRWTDRGQLVPPMTVQAGHRPVRAMTRPAATQRASTRP